MKKIILILFISITSGNMFAQQKHFSINTNLANIAAKGPSLALEYKFTNKWSVQAYASKGEINIYNYYSYKTLIIDVKHKIDKQLYTGSYLRFIEKNVLRYAETECNYPFCDKGKTLKGQGLSIGQTIGYEVFRKKTYNLDLFAGAGYGRFIRQEGDKNRLGFLDVRIGVLTGLNF